MSCMFFQFTARLYCHNKTTEFVHSSYELTYKFNIFESFENCQPTGIYLSSQKLTILFYPAFLMKPVLFHTYIYSTITKQTLNAVSGKINNRFYKDIDIKNAERSKRIIKLPGIFNLFHWYFSDRINRFLLVHHY